MSDTKTKTTQNLGPVDAELHKLLKMEAAQRGMSLRKFLEEKLGPAVDWPPGVEADKPEAVHAA